MSAFDDLYHATRAAKRAQAMNPDEVAINVADLRRIAAALEKARQTEGEPLPEQYVLPDYPGQSATLRIDGVDVGSHGLTIIDGDTCYQSATGVDGVTPALQVRPRRWLRPADDEGRCQASYGDVQRTGVKELDRAILIRAVSRRSATVFLTPELVERLMRLGSKVVSVTVRPEAGRTFVDTVVEVKGSPHAEPAIALARAAHAAMQTLVSTPGGFAETARATELSLDDVLALVGRVKDTVSFLAGHVERVGDGVEARLELDQPTGMHAVLRIEPTGPRELRATFRGDLTLPHAARDTRLEPEVGFLKKAQGLVDTKVGEAALDRAFLIEGDVGMARLALADPSAALRIAGRGGSLALDGAGFHVRVPRVPADNDALLEVVLASVSSWREAARESAGFADAARES